MGSKVRLSLGTDYADVSSANPLPVTTVDAAGAGAEGAKITAATMPAGGSGKLGWLSAIWYQLTQAVATAPASTETKITAATMPAGGVGWMGWLSAIWSLFTIDTGGNLKVSLWSGNGAVAVTSLVDNADGVAVSANARNLAVAIRAYIFNGVGFDRLRKANIVKRIASSAGSGNPDFLKASAGDLKQFWGQNGAAITYLQFYNKASAPTIGSDTIIMTFPIAANERFNIALPQDGGLYFSTGIAFAFTTDAAGTTGAGAAAVTSCALIGA